MPSILAVSDEPFELAGYLGTLGVAAYRLMKVNTPAEALEVLHGDEGIGLLVCDYNLGQHQIDGVELIRQANEIKHRYGIAAILTASHAHVNLQLQVDQLRKEGARVMLCNKSMDLQGIGELIRGIIESQRAL